MKVFTSPERRGNRLQDRWVAVVEEVRLAGEPAPKRRLEVELAALIAVAFGMARHGRARPVGAGVEVEPDRQVGVAEELPFLAVQPLRAVAEHGDRRAQRDQREAPEVLPVRPVGQDVDREHGAEAVRDHHDLAVGLRQHLLEGRADPLAHHQYHCPIASAAP